MTSGSPLILVLPGSVGHGRLGTRAADVSNGQELEPGEDGPRPIHGTKGGEVVAILGQQGHEQPDALGPVIGQDIPRPQVGTAQHARSPSARVESQLHPDDALPIPEHESVIRRIHLPRWDAHAGPGCPGSLWHAGSPLRQLCPRP